MVDNILEFPSAQVQPVRAGSRRRAADVLSLDTRRTAARVERSSGPLSLAEVWDALHEGRVRLQYQPQYRLDTGHFTAAEALVRLVDCDGALVYPDRFIEAVEQSDLIVPLGRAIIFQVCADLDEIRRQGYGVERFAINLSARQLNHDDGLLTFIDQTLAEFDLDYADVEFELTERQRLDMKGESCSVLEALAERGSRLIIDDFGIGYSSVLCLTELPIKAFKLDRSLIDRLPCDQAIESVVHCLLDLATRLDLDVVAEGLETVEQQAWLTMAGCPSAQGFGYAKPMDLEALRNWLGVTVLDQVESHT